MNRWQRSEKTYRGPVTMAGAEHETRQAQMRAEPWTGPHWDLELAPQDLGVGNELLLVLIDETRELRRTLHWLGLLVAVGSASTVLMLVALAVHP